MCSDLLKHKLIFLDVFCLFTASSHNETMYNMLLGILSWTVPKKERFQTLIHNQKKKITSEQKIKTVATKQTNNNKKKKTNTQKTSKVQKLIETKEKGSFKKTEIHSSVRLTEE